MITIPRFLPINIQMLVWRSVGEIFAAGNFFVTKISIALMTSYWVIEGFKFVIFHLSTYQIKESFKRHNTDTSHDGFVAFFFTHAVDHCTLEVQHLFFWHLKKYIKKNTPLEPSPPPKKQTKLFLIVLVVAVHLPLRIIHHLSFNI